ncbi:hypothetical protein CVT26_004662 [Gymnopilus dilepis]|uniref:Uncharacterized protein n=1 Tax=Gymnopilus dilepis TaxID=231916 RepID=A0A409YJF8_9AGAR|nr:hypothetical protein CVT26_004662 [Gymnopilus dilepis]
MSNISPSATATKHSSDPTGSDSATTKASPDETAPSSTADTSPEAADPQPTRTKSPLTELEFWQNTCLLEDRITFNDAVELLTEDEKTRIIEARCGTGYKASTWTARNILSSHTLMFNKKTNQDAIFVHAALWLSSSDLYTGNFVPKGEEAPDRVMESRIQDTPNFKCDISYVLNTDYESSIYTNLEHFEDYIKTVDGFNRAKRPRSRWQDGNTTKSVYTISSKLFVKKAAKPRKPDFEPHEWLSRGLKGRDDFVVNPDRPLYFDLINGKAVKLENSDVPYFQAGDLVWFSFKMSFFVAQKYWTSEIIPLEFMRVARNEEFQESTENTDKVSDSPQTLEDGIAIEKGQPSTGEGSQDDKDAESKAEEKAPPPPLKRDGDTNIKKKSSKRVRLQTNA